MRDDRSRRRIRIAVGAGIALVGAAVVAVAAAQPSGDGGSPVLHERVEGLADFRWDPVEPESTASLVFPGPNPPRPGEEALDPDGPGPARTPTARTAEPPLPPRPDSPVSDVPPEEFHPDLDTDSADLPRDANPPGILWSPSPGPYLRQQVFDVVLADGSLDAPAPRREELRPVEPPDGTPGAERFLGRARLWIADDSVVQIPTPAPDYRAEVLSGASEGDRLAVDRAGNLFFEPGPARGERVLLIALEADPETFGGSLDAAATIGAAPMGSRHDVPETLRGPARRVAERIALSPDMPVETALRLLSTWFRSFRPGPPPSGIPGTAYEELALGRVGLCRHRAYAFVVTAQWLGIPARMPISRLHAWVEVLAPVPGPDGPRWVWRRIDLGGAYGETAQDVADVPAHVPGMADPLPWPRGAQPTPAAATPGATPAAPGTAPGGPPAAGGSAPPPTAGSFGRPPSPTDPPGTPPGTVPGPDDPKPPPEPDGHVAHGQRDPSSPSDPSMPFDPSMSRPPETPLAVIDRYPHDALRGDSVEVTGRVPDGAAAGTLVRFVLETPDGAERDIGSLAVTSAGAFAGTLTIPPDAAPGDYVLRALPAGGW